MEGLFGNERDDKMYEAGWLVLVPSLVYEKRISQSRSVYIWKTDDGKRWEVVSCSFRYENGEPVKASENEMGLYRTMREAYRRATNYIEWYEQNAKKWKGRASQ